MGKGYGMNESVYISILDASTREHSSRDCLHVKRNNRYTTWTYGSFRQDCNRLCAVLKKHGIKQGVNAVVIGENSPEWIIAFHAIILAGGCTVPIDPNIPPDEIETIITTTKAKVVFCSGIFADLFKTLSAKHRCISKIVLLEQSTEGKVPVFNDYLQTPAALSDAFSTPFTPDDPMVIIFTSGTTGKAKGVVLTQKNFTTVCLQGIPRMQITKNDTVCAVLPLHHVFGCAASVIAPLSIGMDIVCVPAIKGPLILEALNDKAVTFLPAVPKMLQLFYESIIYKVKQRGPAVATIFSLLGGISDTLGSIAGTPFKRKLFKSVHAGFGGKLRLIVSGGAALNETHWRGFMRFGFTIVEGYGLSETFGPITVCPGTHPKLGSVGPILPNNELMILHPNPEGIGEVLLRGKCIFKGYYENEQLTHEVLDNDGWLHTGDLGWVDKQGYLFLSGRKKDLIVLDSGKNVYPDELEEYYSTSPLIDELAVFGTQHQGREIVGAVIVPERTIRRTKSQKQAHEIIANELMRMGKKIPAYRRISSFIISTVELPRTTTRKLIKAEITALYLEHLKSSEAIGLARRRLSVADAALMHSTAFEQIIDDICSIAPKTDRSAITPLTNIIAELGLDSMDRLELLNAFERRTQTKIADSVFDKMELVKDFVLYLQDVRK